MHRTPDEYLNEVLRLEAPLRALLHRFAPQPADLEDLLQETYSRLFSLPPGKRAEIQNVQAFAITTARHIAMDWIRRRRIVRLETVDDFAEWPQADEAGLAEIVHTHQQLLRIAAGISQLPEKSREVFVLRRVYGLTQREIATRLGISEGSVEQHLVRGIKRCAELLAADDAGDVNSATRREGVLGRLRRRLNPIRKFR